MDSLRISEDFHLPYEAVTQTFAILAKRGSGKTYTASVMVEEMLKAGLHVAVVDPLGVWWGLRSSADGKSEGLNIVVIGGEHGDLPLTEDMGAAIADLLVNSNVSVVIDLHSFESKAAQIRFMTAFTQTLYHKNRNPLHLVFDEADLFAPQRPMKGEEKLLGAMENIVRRGRSSGLGVTLITQRPASLHKDVLTQTEVLVVLRMTGPHDIAAVDDWVKRNGTPEQRAEFLSSLSKLPIGRAWFWSPGWLDVFQQIQVRRRETFDSSATPKIGAQLVVPDKVATVDMEALRERFFDAIKQAEESDPKKLQEQIAKLQRQLREKPKVEVQRVEVPVIEDAQIAELKALAESMMRQAQELIAFGQEIMTLIGTAEPLKPVSQSIALRPAVPIPPRPIVVKIAESLDVESIPDGGPRLRAGAIKILQTVAQRYPMKMTRAQVATLSGYAVSGGTFGTYFGELKRAGLLAEQNGEVTATEDGIALVGVEPVMPQTTDELLAMWRGSLRFGAGRMLELLVERYPDWISREQLGESAGYAVSGGTFGTYLGDLRRNGLIEENGRDVRASDALFLTAEVAG